MTGTKLLFHSIILHRLDPINHKPISLLNAISKPYARFLYSNDWIVFEVIPEEQAGFRGVCSTLD